MGQLDWSGARWLLIGLPVPSQGLSYVTWAKALGLLVYRVEDTAWGWFHRAATTSRPWQWKDYGSMLTCAQQDPLSSSQVNHHPFLFWVFCCLLVSHFLWSCSGFCCEYSILLLYYLASVKIFSFLIWSCSGFLLSRLSHFLLLFDLGFPVKI